MMVVSIRSREIIKINGRRESFMTVVSIRSREIIKINGRRGSFMMVVYKTPPSKK